MNETEGLFQIVEKKKVATVKNSNEMMIVASTGRENVDRKTITTKNAVAITVQVAVAQLKNTERIIKIEKRFIQVGGSNGSFHICIVKPHIFRAAISDSQFGLLLYGFVCYGRLGEWSNGLVRSVSVRVPFALYSIENKCKEFPYQRHPPLLTKKERERDIQVKRVVSTIHFISAFLSIYSRRTNEIAAKEIIQRSYLPRLAYFDIVVVISVCVFVCFYLFFSLVSVCVSRRFAVICLCFHRIQPQDKRNKVEQRSLINHNDSCRQQTI